MTTELDYAEAYGTLILLEWTFWGLFILLALSSVAIFMFTLVVSRLRREAQKAAIEAQQLGQYALEEKIGAGAMGVVYKARHAMLRRQTAVRLLDVEKVNDASIARLEREVQITCSLEHPNTIAIYDYGRTPEGVFLLRHGVPGWDRSAATHHAVRTTIPEPHHSHPAAGMRFVV